MRAGRADCGGERGRSRRCIGGAGGHAAHGGRGQPRRKRTKATGPAPGGPSSRPPAAGSSRTTRPPWPPPPATGKWPALGADLEPGTILAAYRAGLFPMPARRGLMAWWSPDPRGVSAPATRGQGHAPAGRCAARAGASRSGSTPRSTRYSPPAPTGGGPGRGSTAASPPRTRQLHQLGWVHSVEAWDAELADWPAGSTAWPSEACSPGSRCSTGRPTLSKVALVGLRAAVAECRRRRAAARRAVGHAPPGLPGSGRAEPGTEYHRRLAGGVGPPAARRRSGAEPDPPP